MYSIHLCKVDASATGRYLDSSFLNYSNKGINNLPNAPFSMYIKVQTWVFVYAVYYDLALYSNPDSPK